MSTDEPTPRTQAYEHQPTAGPPTERISATERPAVTARPGDTGGPARFEPDERPAAVERMAGERRRFGGVKIGSAFFGWLTAMGMGVLLTAVLAALGAGIGLAQGVAAGDLVAQAAQDVAGIGVVGAIGLAVVLFVAYYCGGYVAGRMARFNGMRQGLAVWLWAVVIALVLTALGAIFGSQGGFPAGSEILPRVPLDGGALGLAGIVALAIVLLIPLLAAVLGGLAGMRYHRRIDRFLV